MNLESLVLRIMSIVLALILAPCLWLVAMLVQYELGGKGSMIVPSLVSFAAFTLTCWKANGVLRVSLKVLRNKIREPWCSGVTVGVAGGFLGGSILLLAIVFLGHARPVGWELSEVVPFAALAFLSFLVVGLGIGMKRKASVSRSR